MAMFTQFAHYALIPMIIVMLIAGAVLYVDLVRRMQRLVKAGSLPESFVKRAFILASIEFFLMFFGAATVVAVLI